SAGMASKAMPALPSSICRARLCEARISGCFPRQMLIAAASFRQPLSLASAEQFQTGRRGSLDRASCHVKLRPAESGAQSPRIGDFIGHLLAINIVVIAGLGAHAEHPVPP